MALTSLIMLDTFLGQLRYISVDLCWARFIAVLLALCMFYCRLAHLVLPRPTTFLPPHYLPYLPQGLTDAESMQYAESKILVCWK